MKQYIHGTSYESAMNILQNGFMDAAKIWDCSMPGIMYFRELPSETEDNYEDSRSDAYFTAITNGQVAAAYNDSHDTRIGVVVLTMSDELADDIVECDISCENANDCYQIDIDELNKYVNSGNITAKIEIYANAYIPYIRPFYLLDSNSNKYMSIPDKNLKNVIDILNSQNANIIDIILDNMGELDDEFTITPKGV